MTGRQNFFDVLKGVGIVYVFLGHNLACRSLGFSTIFMFHMPLFFMISGYFFDAGSIAGLNDLFRRFLRNLLMPSLVFLCIAAVNAAANGDLMASDHAANLARLRSFWVGQPYFLSSLWFVVCVFWSQLIVFGVSRIPNPFVSMQREKAVRNAWLVSRWTQVRDCAFLVFMFVLAHVLSKEFSDFSQDVPLKLMSVPMCVVFVCLGGLLRCWLQKIERLRLGMLGAIALSAILLSAVAVAARFGHRTTNLCAVTYSTTVMFIFGSIAGIMSSLALAKALDRGVTAAVMAYVGRNSMVFFLMEGVVLMNCTKLVNFLGFDVDFPLFLREAAPGWRVAMTAIGLMATAAMPPLVNPVLHFVKSPFLSKESS